MNVRPRLDPIVIDPNSPLPQVDQRGAEQTKRPFNVPKVSRIQDAADARPEKPRAILFARQKHRCRRNGSVPRSMFGVPAPTPEQIGGRTHRQHVDPCFAGWNRVDLHFVRRATLPQLGTQAQRGRRKIHNVVNQLRD